MASFHQRRNRHWPPLFETAFLCAIWVAISLSERNPNGVLSHETEALHLGNYVQCQEGVLHSEKYFGSPLGPILGHGPVTGTVYVVDESTIFIRGFSFSGSNYKLSFFMGGLTVTPDGGGFIIPDESGSTRPLGDYKEKDIVIRLPEGRTVRDLKWLSIWSRQVHANLGHVFIPPNVDVPSPLELPPLTGLAHGVRSGPISIIDAQTILVTDFWYDGEGPAGYWWVTRGARQSPQGLRLKDENDTPRPLRAYRGEAFLIRLPDSKTVYDFDWFGVYCEEFQVDFGHIHLPQNTRVPPSPRMLGVRPENKLNCEVLNDNRGFEVRWIMDGDDIVMQLVGKLQPREYMAFGLGKDDHHSSMVGADSAVAWIDDSGTGHAIDYFLSSKEPCVGNRGSCPDLKLPGATDSITLLHAAVVNGFSMITFKRPQLGVDEVYDQHVYSDGQQAVIWAIGPLNHRDEVSYHSMHNIGNKFIDFARAPIWNCPRPDESLLKQRRFQRLTAEATAQKFAKKVAPPSTPKTTEIASLTSESQSTFQTTLGTTPKPSLTTTQTNTEFSSKAPNLQPWRISKVRCPKDRTLWAQIGPVGGARGYQAITGRQGWGIAWYINGLLIPEVILKRGVTYTFLVEGGNDESNGARRHPLYLTDSSEGGFEFKSPPERAKERVFGGVGITANGTILPTAEGRMCEWKITPKTNIHDIAGTYPRFEDFQKTLLLDCDTSGRPGIIKFTPDQSTPDTLYYQCFTHRYLGWKIRIVDDCDEDLEESTLLHSAASMLTPVKVAPPSQIKSDASTESTPKGKQTVLVKIKSVQQSQLPQPQITPASGSMHSYAPKQPMQSVPVQQRRPLVTPNGNRNSNYGPHSPLYGSGQFHRNQLNMLPHTMLQGYPHHYQPALLPQQMQYMSALAQGKPISPPQRMNPYPTPQPQNIFNPPKPNPGYYPLAKANKPIHQQPVTPQMHSVPVNPPYPMKKFGHRAPSQSNVANSVHTQSAMPNHVSRQPQMQPMKAQMAPHRQTMHQHSSSGSFGPTSTKPPLHGGFVPIKVESSSNTRNPVTLNTTGQNVWFPGGNQSQGDLVPGARLNKPIKPLKKKPVDIYRIITAEGSGSTTRTTTSPTTAVPVSRQETETPAAIYQPTTILPMPSTTGKLVNDSTYELLTFIPMDSTGNSSTSSNTESPFNRNKWFSEGNAEEVGEESQRRLVMSSLNGFNHLPDRHYEPKPGTVDHVISEAEKTTASEQQGSTDHNILSDVLRLINFNIPSVKRDSSYTPGYIPK